MKSFGVSEDVLKSKSNELSAPFKKHKITLYTIYAMWYLSMVEWGHFGEDRTMNYKSEKDQSSAGWSFTSPSGASFGASPASTRTSWQPPRRLCSATSTA